MCGVPVVLDTHHFNCYSEINKTDPQEPLEYYIPLVLETWGDIKPKFHVSEQGAGKIGHHSDFIEEIPDELLDIPELYDVDIDIMIEAKRKELAIFKLYSKYPEMNCYVK
jgi:UV DNA damage endonuclease